MLSKRDPTVHKGLVCMKMYARIKCVVWSKMCRHFSLFIMPAKIANEFPFELVTKNIKLYRTYIRYFSD